MDPSTRSYMSTLIASDINRHSQRHPLAPSMQEALDQLLHDGIIRLGQVFSKELCANIVNTDVDEIGGKF